MKKEHLVSQVTEKPMFSRDMTKFAAARVLQRICSVLGSVFVSGLGPARFQPVEEARYYVFQPNVTALREVWL